MCVRLRGLRRRLVVNEMAFGWGWVSRKGGFMDSWLWWDCSSTSFRDDKVCTRIGITFPFLILCPLMD